MNTSIKPLDLPPNPASPLDPQKLAADAARRAEPDAPGNPDPADPEPTADPTRPEGLAGTLDLGAIAAAANG